MTEPTGYIICTVCGSRNEAGEDFCGNCGSYLAWDDQTSVDDSTALTDSSAKSSARDPAADQVGMIDDARKPGTESDAVNPSRLSQPASIEAAPQGATVASEASPAPEITLRQPTAPQSSPARRRPPVVQPDERAVAPGDVICWHCGAGNRPERRFCRRCASQLTAAVAPEPSAQPPAGTRPKGRNTRFPFAAIMVLLLIVGGIVVAWLNRDAVIAWVQTVVGFIFSSTGSS